jgi:hypothetical protein
MPNYKNGKIYKVIFDSSPHFYIGATTQPLHKRHYEHKKYPVNKMMIEAVKNKSSKIVLLEAYPCETKYQLEAREQHWIRNLKPALNYVYGYSQVQCEVCDTYEEDLKSHSLSQEHIDRQKLKEERNKEFKKYCAMTGAEKQRYDYDMLKARNPKYVENEFLCEFNKCGCIMIKNYLGAPCSRKIECCNRCNERP